ncbi:hypothetical protein [Tateyamaria sp. SN6-1]|uniref:hypothetical protein n=1 Tax=Tateyamaria sp. SN6-1 TaxID=3092148 RepID=UPI0039F55C96
MDPDQKAELRAQIEDHLKTQEPVAPIRTVHHFACTGGTLICKFLATTPNARVLSEIDPLSTISKAKFSPLDLALQYRNAERNAGLVPRDEDLIEIFLAGLAVIYEKTRQRGERLVIRDHAHSHYCTGSYLPNRPNLRSILKTQYTLLSVVTVRHPLDSYLSLLHNKFTHFDPGTLQDYANRYMAFLDAHEGLPWISYETFLSDTEGTLQELCKHLQLAYRPNLQSLISAITLTGDSGRTGPLVAQRTRREIPDQVAQMRSTSPAYDALCARLRYDA